MTSPSKSPSLLECWQAISSNCSHLEDFTAYCKAYATNESVIQGLFTALKEIDKLNQVINWHQQSTGTK